MKGAKELAEMLRARVGNAPTFPELAMVRHADALAIAAHLDRLAAIDSAVTGEVGDIAAAHAEHRSHFRCDQMPDSIVRMDTLLVIVQRQAADLTAARAEVERLKDRAAKDDAGVTIHACPPKGAGIMPCCGRTPFEVMADRMTTRPEFVNCDRVRLQTERAALAQENARLINEVGELHAKLAAPSVDMTPGMQPRAMRESAGCHAGTDGDCYWSECPQIMDGEPHKSGRSCPLCNSADDS
jgi:hypothetical protein